MEENKLKPGFINHQYNDDPEYPISIDERYTDSMAQAMEESFKAIWPEIMQTSAPKITNHLRMMFVAIAQGVVRHLVENPDAFKITVKFEGDKPGRVESTKENISQRHLHKHRMSTPAYEEDDECNELISAGSIYENLRDCYKKHKHQIEETDKHRHETFATIEHDGTLGPTVSAGSDRHIDESSDLDLSVSIVNTIPPNASNYANLSWDTSGTGYFDDRSLLKPIYIPSDDDKTAGSVTLKLTAYPNGTTDPAWDTMTLTIT